MASPQEKKDYLQSNVAPILTEGLTQLAKLAPPPKNPALWLSHWLAQESTTYRPSAAVQWDAKKDAAALQTAFKGVGTDNKAVIDIIARRTRKHLVEVAKEYAAAFPGRDLVGDLKGETSSSFRKALVALVRPRMANDADLVQSSMRGLGTDEGKLIEVLCTRSPRELQAMQDAYVSLYGRTVEMDVKGDTSGSLLKLLLALLAGGREDDTAAVDLAAARADAQLLYQNGEAKLIGANDEVFIDVLSRRSRAHIEAVNWAYADLRGYSLVSAIEKKFSGHLQRALRILAMPPVEYFAETVNKACVGAGTNDEKVLRVITSLTKDQLREVNRAYIRKYGRSLRQEVRNETSGSFKQLLLALIPDALGNDGGGLEFTDEAAAGEPDGKAAPAEAVAVAVAPELKVVNVQ